MNLTSLVRRIPAARRFYRSVRRVYQRSRSRIARSRALWRWQYGPLTVLPGHAGVEADLRRLIRRNRLSLRRVVSPDNDVVVSMTTHGVRALAVHIALESIGRGSAKPGRLVLWLDDPALFARLPRSLKRLRRRGLEIALVPAGLGVHTKHYPYATSVAQHSVSMVTSDDDVLYPPNWLDGLLREHANRPDIIACWRAHTIRFDGDRIAPYRTWLPCTDTVASVRNFGTSVSGQLLPPAFLDRVREAGTAFIAVAPDADDIWLHHLAVSTGTPVAQVTEQPQLFHFVPGSQETGLHLTNVWGDKNDDQILATYTSDDLEALREAVRS